MKLKELRLSFNMKQAEVAKKIGCSPVVYSRYEREERQPDINILWKIADIYQVTLDEIVGRQNLLSKVDTR